jgi:hypothetical protein
LFDDISSLDMAEDLWLLISPGTNQDVNSGASEEDVVTYLAPKLRLDSQVFLAKQDRGSGEVPTKGESN